MSCKTEVMGKFFQKIYQFHPCCVQANVFLYGTKLDWTKLAETKLARTKLAGLKCLETKSSETKTVLD